MPPPSDAPAPLVSVVVGTFNAGRFIEATLRSVLDQTYRRLELLVVDDASTDDTVTRVRRVARDDDRVRLIALEHNSGRPALPRNTGIAAAHGELVAFLDGDDLWSPWKLADQVATMTRHDDLVLVYSMIRFFGDVHGATVERGVRPLPCRAALSRGPLERENTIACSSVLARLDRVRALGGFDEDPGLAAVEDWDLWLRLSATGPIGFIPRIHGSYRVHKTGISRRTDMKARVLYLYGRHGISVPTRTTRTRGLVWTLTRAGVHESVVAWSRAVEWLTRGRQRVPLRRGTWPAHD